MNNPPDLSICLSVNFIRWIIRLNTVEGGKWRIERTTRYSCSTVVGHVIVNRETLVFKHKWTISPGQEMTSCWVCTKKSSLQLRCSQPWASDAEALGLNLTPAHSQLRQWTGTSLQSRFMHLITLHYPRVQASFSQLSIIRVRAFV